MAAKGLPAATDDKDSTDIGQESPVLQVNITDEDTKQRIRRSLRSFGFPKIGTGVRVVLDTFAKSDEVQRVVRKQLGVHAPTPVEER